MSISLNTNALISTTELLTFNNVASMSSKVSGVTDSDYQNTLINLTSQFIEQYTKRVLKTATYTSEKYNGNGTHFLQLDKYPVTTLTSVILWDTTSNSALTTYTQYTDYLLHGDGSTGMIWLRQGFALGVNNYQITYTAGYSASTLPYDLRYACALLCYHIYKNSGKIGMDSERIGNYSYKMSSQGNISIGGLFVPSEILSMLEMYVRKEIV
jgi:uncharacterized phiE125 gp8 family phage protein